MSSNPPKKVYTYEESLAVLQSNRDNAYQRLFLDGAGVKLTKKRGSTQGDVATLVQAANQVGHMAASAAGAASEVAIAGPAADALELVLKLTSLTKADWPEFAEMMAEELAVIGGKTAEAVACALVPYFSTGVAAKNMMVSWGNMAMAAHKAYRTARTIEVDILPGDATQAARAVNSMIKRARDNHARIASIHTVKFAIDTAAITGGLGAGGAVASVATGAAAMLATTANTLFLLGRDYMEMKSANDLLERGLCPSAETLFSKCPLLGCYLITGAEDSDLLYFLVPAINKKGFMDEIEKMKKQTLGPLQESARQMIVDARYELAGFKGKQFTVGAKKSGARRVQTVLRKLIGLETNSFGANRKS